MEPEFRSYGLNFRTVDNENEKIIEGHAVVFNRQTNVGGFYFEVIDSGAFDKTDLRDVPLVINHDFSKIPLARSGQNGNNTLTLTVDDKGLAIRAKLDTNNNSDARALYSAVLRGDITGMSFAFRVGEEEWQNLDTDMPTRRIKSIKQVFEVSACTFPQYDGTDLNARSANTNNAKKVLDNARAQSVGGFKNEIEVLKLQNSILGGF